MNDKLKGLGPVQRALLGTLEDGTWMRLPRLVTLVYGLPDGPRVDRLSYMSVYHALFLLRDRGLVEVRKRGGKLQVRTRVWRPTEGES